MSDSSGFDHVFVFQNSAFFFTEVHILHNFDNFAWKFGIEEL